MRRPPRPRKIRRIRVFHPPLRILAVYLGEVVIATLFAMLLVSAFSGLPWAIDWPFRFEREGCKHHPQSWLCQPWR